MKEAKILSWNILEGVHQSWESDPQIDAGRLEKIAAVIDQERPAVVVFNEALWSRAVAGKWVDYASLLGFKYSFADTYDGPWGNVILSQEPLIAQRRFRIHNRGGLVVGLEGGLNVATYHPHPSRYPAHKAKDFEKLLAGLSGPSVVCGDFNAISPYDKVNEVALTEAFARFSPTPASSLARFTEGGRAVFDTLEKLGFRDALSPEKRSYTMPTDLISLDKKSAMRIDHIWVNSLVTVESAQVLKTPMTELASDHYPVIAQVQWRECEP